MASRTFVNVYFLGQLIEYEGTFQRYVPQNHTFIQSIINKHLLRSRYGADCHYCCQ